MRQTYIQLCEFSSRFRILKGGKISLVVSAFIASSSLVYAAPSGGVVTSGSATISQSGTTTNITQSTNKASINWQNFSIQANETVNFNQPSVNSITLNRVVGNERSVIDGAMNANGQVWILNSNGVLFGKNASINTAGLLATTSSLSDADFNAGNYNFSGASDNSIINLGTITISNEGYAILSGKEVQNQGNITALRGKVHLVGADEVSINLNGNSLLSLTVNKGLLDSIVQNSGSIQADGGEVYLTTNAVDELLKGVVNNTGVIEAKSLDDAMGKIVLFAHGGSARIDGTLDASGGFIETSGKSLHVEDSAIIKTKTWLLDPDNITIESIGGGVGGESVSATAIQNALSTANIELQAVYDITVNENITWATDKKLTLTAGDEIFVNTTIENTNTTNGGVFFNAANVQDKVIFDATTGKVIIHNPYQLQWMNQALDGNYELGRDIDASVTSGWNGGKGWIPIVKSEVVGMYATYYGFTGNFDGLGHTVSNLTIDDTTRDYVGLFGRTNGALVQNVGLVNVNITGRVFVGALVGDTTGGTTIANAYATGSVSGHQYIGGLVGTNTNSSTIKNSYAVVNVDGFEIVGGLVATNGSSIIENSYASGTVTGTNYLGGLYGFSAGTITNSHYDNQANNVGTMHDSSLGRTKDQLLALVTGGTWNNTTIWGANGSNAKGYAADAITLPFLRSVTKFDNTLFAGGMGIEANPYTITNWTQLQNINYASDTTLLSKYYTLSNNISSSTAGYTNSGEGWKPIGNSTNNFTGNFNGASHTISDLFINRPTTDAVGLFGSTAMGTIQNIGVTNVNIKGQSEVGGLVGGAGWTAIVNSYSTGKVEGSGDLVGGLAGTFAKQNITNSYSTVSVTGRQSVGGLVGRASIASITNSYASGSVTGTDDYVGGLVGLLSNTSTIANSYATGEVIGTRFVGGLVGVIDQEASIANTYATGKVTGTDIIGGLVGFNVGDIKTSYATGQVSGGTDVGGLVGGNTYVDVSDPTKNITGTIDAVSFWNTQTSGQTTSAGGGTGKTTAQMKESATYNSWDILEDNTIKINYPTLRMANSGKVWVIGTKGSTPQPTQEPTPTPKPNVSHIENGTASFVSTEILQQTKSEQIFAPTLIANNSSLPSWGNGTVEIINGGVRLPVGIDREFSMTEQEENR